MAVTDRLEYYDQLEAHRGNPLIVYATSQRFGAAGRMAGDVVDEFIDQIEALNGQEIGEIDLILISTGGDSLAAFRIVSLLRTVTEKINLLVPHSAYSAATILSLGCDKILMGKYGCLGPIDPQITVREKDGTLKQFAYEDIVSFLDFVNEDVGLTEQSYKETAFEMLTETVEPSSLGFAKRSSFLAETIGELMLKKHMTTPEDQSKISNIVNQLNKSFFNHSQALHREEAKEIGLNVEIPDEQTEELMWKIHKSLEADFRNREPYDPVAEFLADPNAAPYLQPPPPLHIPPNVDQGVAIQLMQAHWQTQLNVNLPNVMSEINFAVVESNDLASECYERSKVLIARTIDLNFFGNAVKLEYGWRNTYTKPPEEPIFPDQTENEDS